MSLRLRSGPLRRAAITVALAAAMIGGGYGIAQATTSTPAPSVTSPTTATPIATTPAPTTPAHHCPNMGSTGGTTSGTSMTATNT